MILYIIFSLPVVWYASMLWMGRHEHRRRMELLQSIAASHEPPFTAFDDFPAHPMWYNCVCARYQTGDLLLEMVHCKEPQEYGQQMRAYHAPQIGYYVEVYSSNPYWLVRCRNENDVNCMQPLRFFLGSPGVPT